VNIAYDINTSITANEVRVIGSNGNQIGVLSIDHALNLASKQGMDLVQINPSTVPPLCRIVDFGKFKYELVQKDKEQKKKNRANMVETKELQLRPVTDNHDIGIKANRAKEFLEKGDKVRIVVKFKGRELMHQEMGRKVMDAMCAAVGEENYKVDSPIAINGKQLTMTMAPNKK
jgi:translation initiation factor IF-3